MAGGYKAPRDGTEQLTGAMADQRERLRELERPTGTSIGSLVQQVQQTLANIVAQVNTIATAWMAANAYTKAQVDSKVASPGTIAPVDVNASGNVSAANVTASGQVVSAGIVRSPGTKSNTVTVGYSAVYIDSSGNMGGNTSTRRSKTNIVPLEIDLDAFLGLQAYRFQRHTDVLEMGEGAPWQSGLMAEDVEPVAPLNVWLDEDGLVAGVRYEELVVPLLMAVQRERTLRVSLEERVAALEAQSVADGGVS
ncbi:tail fiber domain-containing protein [Leifsonia sp. ZF2019]|uniref:tail fiber domain-containing protein n=1 Tax=Leifsonia sp. ZF2019 TaxID=2781978 RepID=UPI001CBE0063|nr:tail fiber domain-containing protein [Leifsonia sp. ZF2019]UAJ78306.1 tail fiber domain-containing protein [Leifsonia sp. ZF2019]UAJ79936.1 tail fiber domain-containing protein [Leifsonia sp. ZF2019]